MEPSRTIRAIRGTIHSTLTAALVWASLHVPTFQGCTPAPLPPAPAPTPSPPPPAPVPPVPPTPAPRPADEFAGKLWDAYHADGGPNAVNAGAKEQLRAVYAVAVKLATDRSVSTGEQLRDKVKAASKTLLDDHYLGALPKLRAAIGEAVADTLSPDALTDESRRQAAALFTRIADALGKF